MGNMRALYHPLWFKPKPLLYISTMSTCFVMNVLTYFYNLSLNLFTGSVNKFLYYHHETPSQMSLIYKCLNLPSEQKVFILSSAHLDCLRYFMKFFSAVNICVSFYIPIFCIVHPSFWCKNSDLHSFLANFAVVHNPLTIHLTLLI